MSKDINNDWSLIGKYLNGEATIAEKARLEKELATSDKFQKEFDDCKSMFNNINSYYQSNKFDSYKAWPKIQSTINSDYSETSHPEKQKTRLIQKFYKYAAIILLILSLGIVAYYAANRINPGYLEVATIENQVIKNYLLPDGSHVTLNNNTELKYAKNFETDLREVYINGEAFFDVVPNPEKPFVIHAGNAMVTVLGTSFNVCAYPKDKKVEVLVETGKVHITSENSVTKEQNPEALLIAGEKGTLLIAENRIEKTINSDKNLLAWKTGVLDFNQTPLVEVIKYLQNIYHIKIDVKQNEINSLVLTARFDEKPVEFVLEVICLTFDLNLSKESQLYVLSKKLK